MGSIGIHCRDGVHVFKERAGRKRPRIVRQSQKLVIDRARSRPIVESQHGDRGNSIDPFESDDNLCIRIVVFAGEILDGNEGGRYLGSVPIDETTPHLANRVGSHGEFSDDALKR